MIDSKIKNIKTNNSQINPYKDNNFKHFFTNRVDIIMKSILPIDYEFHLESYDIQQSTMKNSIFPSKILFPQLLFLFCMGSNIPNLFNSNNNLFIICLTNHSFICLLLSNLIK